MAGEDDDLSDEAPTAADLVRVRKVLEAVVRDRSALSAIDADEREALLMAAGRVSRPERNELRKLRRVLRKQDREDQKAHDAALIESTGMRQARRESVFGVPETRGEAPGAPDGWTAKELKEPTACYICKADFTELHHFYDQMCPPCAALNWSKRFQSADLTGKVVVITGARVKIGYQAVLMLLRAGARVIATTRFARDAARRFAREPDHDVWASRLEVHGIDLRHVPSVEVFARHLLTTLPRLDALVNNAAQTVRHAPAFFGHLLPREAASIDALPPAEAALLRAGEGLKLRAQANDPSLLVGAQEDAAHAMVAWGGAPALGLANPAGLSQLPLTPDDLDRDPALYPEALDADEQQVDLRAVNSWRYGADEVPTPELLETHLVNAIAPFLLTTRLAPLLERSSPSHIVQVSAMEASFDRRVKTDRHPHTNMAKASLNMLTRTSAVDYAARGIYMNSVDTGWVTDEDPYAHSVRKAHVHGFSPPLDAVDGAARVLDPLFVGLTTGDHPWGHFFKDYGPVRW